MELDLSRGMLADLKARARTLRTRLLATGVPTTHSQALELVARQDGARDGNTLHARVSRPRHLALGTRVAGTYLGQPFTGRVHALRASGRRDRMHLTLQFDKAVDVVRFDSFSSLRRRISATVGADGTSPARTSDGEPHLRLERIDG